MITEIWDLQFKSLTKGNINESHKECKYTLVYTELAKTELAKTELLLFNLICVSALSLN